MREAATPRLSVEAFLAWAMGRPDGKRWELEQGEPVAMAPERAGHGRAKLRIAEQLGQAVRRAALPCEVFVDGMAVQIDDHTVYEPDVLLRCGPPVGDDVIKLTDPVIIVEVLSPSSQSRDTGAKLADYFRLPTLRHYVIVRLKDSTLIHHVRTGGGEILTRIMRDGRLDFGGGLVLDNLFQDQSDGRP